MGPRDQRRWLTSTHERVVRKEEQRQAQAANLSLQADTHAATQATPISQVTAPTQETIEPGLLFSNGDSLAGVYGGDATPASNILNDLSFGDLVDIDLRFSTTDASLRLDSSTPPDAGATLSSSSEVPDPPPARPSAQISRGSLRSILVSPPPSSAPENEGWLSPLHLAAQAGHVTITQLLLSQGVDPDERDSDGKTALTHAAIENHPEAIKALLEAGAKIGAADRDGRSALHWAVLHQREEVLDLLLRCWEERGGAQELDIDVYDDAGFTPLHIAVHMGFEAGVLMLLRCGANVKFKARKCPHLGTTIPFDKRNMDLESE